MANSSLPRQALVVCGLLAACGKPTEVRVLDLADFPRQVGPPFGLDVLAGGMSAREVSLVLGRINGSGHGIDYSLRNANLGILAGHRIDYSVKNESLGVAGRLAFDGDRLGDIVFTFENCDAVRSILSSSWGAPSEESFRLTKQLLWQSAQSRWFASMEIGLRACRVAFTSSDFFGATVAAFAQFSQLKPGMSRAAATQVSREVATAGLAIEIQTVVDGLQGVGYDRTTDRIEQVYSILPPRAIAALRRAWGNGAISSGEPRMVWFDDGTGDRATLEDDRVTIDKATRWEDWLGDGPSIKALGSVLGKSIDDLRKERGAAFREDTDVHDKFTLYSLRLQAEEWDPGSSNSASLHLDHEVVTSAAVSLLYTTPAIRDQMVRRFEAKWGTKTATKHGIDFKVGDTTVSILDLDTQFQINMMSAAYLR